MEPPFATPLHSFALLVFASLKAACLRVVACVYHAIPFFFPFVSFPLFLSFTNPLDAGTSIARQFVPEKARMRTPAAVKWPESPQ